jgi:hypothetical protein
MFGRKTYGERIGILRGVCEIFLLWKEIAKGE